MYCIDGVSTLKNCKPALIHEPLNRVKNKHANKLGTALRESLASVKGLLLGDGTGTAVSAPNFVFAQA